MKRVEAMEKRHTIRNFRKKRNPVAGDQLSLRYWKARPYNSPQVIMHDVTCVRVAEFYLDEFGRMQVDGSDLNFEQRVTLAIADGFQNVSDLVDYHRQRNTLPFAGLLIEW